MNSRGGPGRLAVRWVVRGGLVVMAAGAVWGGAFLFWGPATLARVYRQDEVARFAPTFHGVGQLLGETFLLALATYVGRRWLRIRL